MFGVIGLTATVGVVRYFFEKMNKNSDEKLKATPANKVREKSTSDHEKFSAPKQQKTKNEFRHNISGFEKHESELKEKISKSSATNRIINSDKQLDVDSVQSKFTGNKVDICYLTKDVEAPKEVKNDQNFLQIVEGSHIRSSEETGSPIKSSVKNTDLNQTDINKADYSHEKIHDIYEKVNDSHKRSSDKTDSPVQSSIKNTDLHQTDENKAVVSHEKEDGSHEILSEETRSPVQSSTENTGLERTDVSKVDDSNEKVDCSHEKSANKTGSQEQSCEENLQQTYNNKTNKMLADGTNVTSTDNEDNLSFEKETFKSADNILSLIYVRVLESQKIMNERNLPLFPDLRPSNKNIEKFNIDTLQHLSTDIKHDEDYIKDSKNGDVLNDKLVGLLLLLLEIRKYFVTKMNAALELDYKQRIKSVDEIDSECKIVVNFLTNYSGQLKTATNILKTILKKVDDNTLVFESESNTWNKIVCGVKKNVESLSSKTFNEVNIEKIKASESQFSKILNFLVV